MNRSTLSGVEDEVRDFYDQYPYPRPVDSLEEYSRFWTDPHRRRADHYLFQPHRSYREDQSILIAGCGTSQAAKHALRWPGAHVTGIDISMTSLRCTEELKRKYNLKNLELHQLPVERAGDLKMTFDQIVCTGVLHHLRDPDAGLRALREVLNPDGVMHLMVYAPYGRAGIYMLQEFCARIGIHAADDEIRDLVVALKALPPGHPLENLLRLAPDFREEAALADALLHPQDRAYSVPQLFTFIERGGLRFGRWIKQAPYSPRCGVVADIPHASRIANLPLVSQYAAVELFRGTMVCHSAILYRNDNPDGPQRVSFAGRTWLDYIPIRMTDTICVEDRVPPGAAGILINRTHTYKDLLAPITAKEKRLLDAIDGKRRIRDLGERTDSESDMRRFFEQLWWYDQVVFDTSQVSVRRGL